MTDPLTFSTQFSVAGPAMWPPVQQFANTVIIYWNGFPAISDPVLESIWDNDEDSVFDD